MRIFHRKPPEAKPAFRAKLLEDPALLAESGKAEEIRAFLAERAAPLEPGLQMALAERFYNDIHNRAVARLLAPLAIPSAAALIIRPLNEALGNALPQLQIVAGFVVGIFAAALYGRKISTDFGRSFSSKAGPMLESFDLPLAHERICNVVSEGEDAPTAFALLSGGKMASYAAQRSLAEVIYMHGTKEQARKILENESVPESAKGILRLKCD